MSDKSYDFIVQLCPLGEKVIPKENIKKISLGLLKEYAPFLNSVNIIFRDNYNELDLESGDFRLSVIYIDPSLHDFLKYALFGFIRGFFIALDIEVIIMNP